jgi:hypothetical protein
MICAADVAAEWMCVEVVFFGVVALDMVKV